MIWRDFKFCMTGNLYLNRVHNKLAVNPRYQKKLREGTRGQDNTWYIKSQLHQDPPLVAGFVSFQRYLQSFLATCDSFMLLSNQTAIIRRSVGSPRNLPARSKLPVDRNLKFPTIRLPREPSHYYHRAVHRSNPHVSHIAYSHDPPTSGLRLFKDAQPLSAKPS